MEDTTNNGGRVLRRLAPVVTGLAMIASVTVMIPQAGAATPMTSKCHPAASAKVKATLVLQARSPYKTVKILADELVRVESSYQNKLLTIPKLERASTGATACLVSSRRLKDGNKAIATFYVGNLTETSTFKAFSTEVHPSDAAVPVLKGSVQATARITS
jgi:hypothetical protein